MIKFLSLSALMGIVLVSCQHSYRPATKIKLDTISLALYRVSLPNGKMSGFQLDTVIIKHDTIAHWNGTEYVQDVTKWGRIAIDSQRDAKGKALYDSAKKTYPYRYDFYRIPSDSFAQVVTIPTKDLLRP